MILNELEVEKQGENLRILEHYHDESQGKQEPEHRTSLEHHLNLGTNWTSARSAMRINSEQNKHVSRILEYSCSLWLMVYLHY